jgi:Putative transposase DNA-binding domain
MRGNALRTVGAERSMRSNGELEDKPAAAINLRRAGMHFDVRPFTLGSNQLSLHTFSRRGSVLRIEGHAIAREDLTNIRKRSKAGLRVRTRLLPFSLPQLQDILAEKAAEFAIATVLTNQAYTGMACSQRGQIGSRIKHRLVCDGCARRAHRDVNAASNHARLGESARSPRAAVNRPDGMENWPTRVGLQQ